MKDFDIDFELLIVLYLILNIIYVYNKNISTGIRERRKELLQIASRFHSEKYFRLR